jgi:hypothetical protein
MASGAPSLSVPLASADFEVFRDRTTFSNLLERLVAETPEPPVAELGSEKDSLLRFDSPSEYDRGALPERLSPFLSRRLAPTRSGPPLLGFFVPTTFDSGCPVSATIGSTDRGRRGLPHPRPVPPSGFVHSTQHTQRTLRCPEHTRSGFRGPSAV